MSRLALWAHTNLPAWALASLKLGRSLTFRKDERLAELEKSFFEMNDTNNPTSITLREGVSFEVHQESFESFQWFCWKSLQMHDEYNRFLEICRGRRRFIDVGACHGIYALTFAAINPDASIVAMEPSPLAQAVLTTNIAKNSLESRIRVIPNAIGLEQEERKFHKNWHHLEAYEGPGEGIKLTTRSIDSLAAEFDFVADCLKIDVEGHELFALQGASRTLASRPPLFLEIHPLLTKRNGYDHSLCFDELMRYDYQVFEVEGKKIDKNDFSRRHHTFFTFCL